MQTRLSPVNFEMARHPLIRGRLMGGSGERRRDSRGATSARGLNFMSQGEFYLRANVAAEPLIDRWYAWSHLVAPATAARNLTERHLRIMDSYLADPDAHAEAARNPALAGGPFVQYGCDRSAEVAALRERTMRERRDLIELSKALGELEATIEQEARGYSLETLYERVPAPLDGLVELTYDLWNRASYRLIEPLVYRRYYRPDTQSLMLSLVKDDDRPFMLSTPRLDDCDSLHWPVSFESARLDALFALKRRPAKASVIGDLLDLSNRNQSLIERFLTPTAPPEPKRYDGPDLRWRYFGHACVLVETADCAILTDPAISYRFDQASARLTYADLPPYLDFVLLTHAHQDHVVLETLLPLRDRIGTILVPRSSGGHLQDPSLKLLLTACGFRHVVELAEMEEVKHGTVTVQAIPFFGEHCDLEIQTKTAWLVRNDRHSMLFAADSRNINPALYEAVREQTGDIDVLFIGMECDGAPLSWIYGPLLTHRIERGIDQSRRANASDYAGALRLAEIVKCRQLYVYALGQEPWLHFISSIRYDENSNPIVHSDRLIRTLRERGIGAQRLFGCHEAMLT
jgi:L-ascorbate metabolism protein UlaG (beta-lactamase superfamily)